MSLALPPQLAACLEVLYAAAVEARLLGYEGHERGLTSRQADQLADLMDAIHNIPHQLCDWERCDESLLRAMLHDYDVRWGGSLLVRYEAKLS